jgi:pimeloyl-ACP methyl ester carboxylesterase
MTPMQKMFARVAVCALFLLSFCAIAGRAQTPPVIVGPCQDGVLPGGALSRICVPSSGWNGDLVVWAHGYTAFNEPLDFQNLVLPDGSSLTDLVQSLGFAFATTSYRQNGLAILEGVDDIRELVAAFPSVAGQSPRRTFATGASEGGIVTTLLIERSPELFTGALSACGPIGSFRGQLNYIGDFRVVFDYFFPGVIPGSSINIPDEVIDNWDAIYVPKITQALQSNPSAARQLLRVTNAPIDPADSGTIAATTTNLLWYNVFGTNDGVAKLGGNPFDNHDRIYFGSSNDVRLNLMVKRFTASLTALNQVKLYETSGRLTRPMVTLHTTGDPIIPFAHEILYLGKLKIFPGGNFFPASVARYGHCAFNTQEAVSSFALLLLLSGN